MVMAIVVVDKTI